METGGWGRRNRQLTVGEDSREPWHLWESVGRRVGKRRTERDSGIEQGNSVPLLFLILWYMKQVPSWKEDVRESNW